MTVKERLIDIIEQMPDEKIEQVYMFVITLDDGSLPDLSGTTQDELRYKAMQFARMRKSSEPLDPQAAERVLLNSSPSERLKRNRSLPKEPLFPMKEGETIDDVLSRLCGALVDDGRSYEELRDEIIEERYGSSY